MKYYVNDSAYSCNETHTHIYLHIYIYIHIYIHTHTHSLSLSHTHTHDAGRPVGQEDINSAVDHSTLSVQRHAQFRPLHRGLSLLHLLPRLPLSTPLPEPCNQNPFNLCLCPLVTSSVSVISRPRPQGLGLLDITQKSIKGKNVKYVTCHFEYCDCP